MVRKAYGPGITGYCVAVAVGCGCEDCVMDPWWLCLYLIVLLPSLWLSPVNYIYLASGLL